MTLVLEQSLHYAAFTATLHRFDHWRVLMYLDDHPPPHVHVKFPHLNPDQSK
jgi:hypothetical protein